MLRIVFSSFGACVAPIALVAGCSYPQFEFTADAAAADAAADVGFDATADSAPSVDALEDTTEAVDTSVVDAPMDSGSDTNVDAPIDAPPVGCGTGHLFCVDFDTGATVTTGWTGDYVTANGNVGFDTAHVTAPRSFLSKVTGTSDMIGSAILTYAATSPSPGTMARYEADVLLDSATYPGPAPVLLLKLQRSDAGDGVGVTLDNVGLNISALGTGFTNQPAAYTITPGKWFHVKVEATLKASGGEMHLYVDGVQVASRTGISTASVDDTTRSFAAGLYEYMGTATFAVHLDDVSFDFVP